MEMLTITCQACAKSYRIPAEKLPRAKQIVIPCPNCKARITINRDPSATGAAAGSPQGSPSIKRYKAGGLSKIRAQKTATGSALKAEILGTIKDLPPMPQTVLKAQEIISNPDSGIKELTEAIEKDQAITTQMVRLANSAYYGLTGKIGNVQKAITMLGQQTLREILMTAGYSGLLNRTLEGYGYVSGDLWRHSIAVGLAARFVASEKGYEDSSEAYLAGLIHDSGKLVLDPYLANMKSDLAAFMEDESQTLLAAERHLFGFDHADIASEVCRKWHVPPAIATAVRYHHSPSKSNDTDLAYIVHLADYIARTGGLGYEEDDYLYLLEDGTLDYLQLDHKTVSGISAKVIENLVNFQDG